MAKHIPRALARPTNPQVQAIVAKQASGGLVGNGVVTLAYVMAVSLTTIMGAPGWVSVILIIVGLGLVSSYILVPLLGSGATYRRYLRAGEIIPLDKYLLEAWDELVKEANLELTDQERNAQIANLFDAARDLRSDLAEHRRLQGAADQANKERKLYLEARIRARLLQEVNTLKHHRQAVQDALAELPMPLPILESGVTQDEVLRQLQILQERETNPDHKTEQ